MLVKECSGPIHPPSLRLLLHGRRLLLLLLVRWQADAQHVDGHLQPLQVDYAAGKGGRVRLGRIRE